MEKELDKVKDKYLKGGLGVIYVDGLPRPITEASINMDFVTITIPPLALPDNNKTEDIEHEIKSNIINEDFKWFEPNGYQKWLKDKMILERPTEDIEFEIIEPKQITDGK